MPADEWAEAVSVSYDLLVLFYAQIWTLVFSVND